jgi:ketosteroid isomerase-like protein
MSYPVVARLMACVMGLSVLRGGVMAQTADEKETAKNAIWAKEQAIAQGSASVGLKLYLDNASPNYVGWPPDPPKPMALPVLKQASDRMAGPDKQELTQNFVDFTMHGDTGVIYFINHRTSMPDGRPVNQKWEIIHVWVRDNGDWKIVGAMARQEPKRAAP